MKNRNVFVTNFRNQGGMLEATDTIRNGGKLIPITEGNINVFNSDGLKTTINYIFHDYNFDPKKDIILIAGSSIIAAIVMKVITSKLLKADLTDDISILLYDGRTQDYHLRAI